MIYLREECVFVFLWFGVDYIIMLKYFYLNCANILKVCAIISSLILCTRTGHLLYSTTGRSQTLLLAEFNSGSA